MISSLRNGLLEIKSQQKMAPVGENSDGFLFSRLETAKAVENVSIPMWIAFSKKSGALSLSCVWLLF